MGFLKRADKSEDVDPSRATEEMYERVFAKIARDFVHRDDFIRIMNDILFMIDPNGFNHPDVESDTEARRKALEYKSVLDSGRNGAALYEDIIDMDE